MRGRTLEVELPPTFVILAPPANSQRQLAGPCLATPGDHHPETHLAVVSGTSVVILPLLTLLSVVGRPRTPPPRKSRLSEPKMKRVSPSVFRLLSALGPAHPVQIVSLSFRHHRPSLAPRILLQRRRALVTRVRREYRSIVPFHLFS